MIGDREFQVGNETVMFRHEKTFFNKPGLALRVKDTEEAGAIAAMVAAGAREIAELAVIADSPSPVPPCGGCRQKIAEFADGDVPVTMATTSGKILRATVSELLPGAFDTGHMDRA